jgi:hypothetical protein
MENKMTRDEVMKFMLESINNDNRDICRRGNMPEDQIEKSIKESAPAILLIVGSLYDKLKEKNLLV